MVLNELTRILRARLVSAREDWARLRHKQHAAASRKGHEGRGRLGSSYSVGRTALVTVCGDLWRPAVSLSATARGILRAAQA